LGLEHGCGKFEETIATANFSMLMFLLMTKRSSMYLWTGTEVEARFYERESEILTLISNLAQVPAFYPGAVRCVVPLCLTAFLFFVVSSVAIEMIIWICSDNGSYNVCEHVSIYF
jgi:hypothetical protein